MGKEWDNLWGSNELGTKPSGTPSPTYKHQTMQTWHTQWAREVYRVLKPGAHLLAMGGTRTFHRLACALEDAGFEIRDTLMWVYGSGFPKSLDVSKAIDKMKGAEREMTGRAKAGHEGFQGADCHSLSGGWDRPWAHDKEQVSRYHAETAPATPEAAQWQGWGTALKPAYEPIILARKPLESTVAANVLKYGTGGLNIDASRVATDWETDPTKRGWQGGYDALRFPTPLGTSSITNPEKTRPHLQGRWPANVILSHFYEPVMSLAGTSLSAGESSIIRGYFANYPDLQKLWGEFRVSASMAEGRTTEVLQQEVLRRVEDRGEEPDGRSETLREVEEADEHEQATDIRREASELEGREMAGQQGISNHHDSPASKGGPSAGQGNGEREIHIGASDFDGEETGPASKTARKRPPHQRHQGRQSNRESSDVSRWRAHEKTQGGREAAESVSGEDWGIGGREPILEILASDIPSQWMRFFEPSGYIGCVRRGVKKVRSSTLLRRHNLSASENIAMSGPNYARSPRRDYAPGGEETVEDYSCHPDCPIRMLDEQSGEIHGGWPERASANRIGNFGIYNKGWGGYGNRIRRDEIGGASRFFYCAKASREEREAGLNPKEGEIANRHPTVKPIALMRYLIRFVTPPSGLVLDPFLGSGTTLLAARLENMNALGIEKDAEMEPIIRSRLSSIPPPLESFE